MNVHNTEIYINPQTFALLIHTQLYAQIPPQERPSVNTSLITMNTLKIAINRTN